MALAHPLRRLETTMIDIAALDQEERLRLLEALWESLSKSPDAVPLTAPQRDELDRRLADLDRDGPIGAPAENVLNRLSGRQG